jgi:hypothetical protein
MKTQTKTEVEEPLTWQKLVRAEPQFKKLMAEVRATERELWATREDGVIRLEGYRSHRVYRELIRPEVTRLVGWDRRRGPEFLKTRQAFGLAIDTLYEALPDDFDDDEIEEAREIAYEAELEEGDWLLVIDPDDD